MSWIVDSHVHFRDAARLPQAWMGREHAAIARRFSPPDLRPCLQRDVAGHGNVMSNPDRLMYGSDWPVALLDGNYQRVWNATRKAVEEAAPGSADALLGPNARRVYRLSEMPAHEA